MRILIGCSTAIVLVVFIVVFVVSLAFRDASWAARVTIALVPTGMALIAVLLLSCRDALRYSATMRTVRNRLLKSNDSTDDEFIMSAPAADAAILLETRKAISQFFDVPTSKIRREIHLVHDLRVDKLTPSFQFVVVESVIASQSVELQPFTFSTASLTTIDELAVAIQDILDGFPPSAGNQDDSTG